VLQTRGPEHVREVLGVLQAAGFEAMLASQMASRPA
jgi:hypothetical protein